MPSFARGLILITRKAQRRGHFPDCPEPEAFRVESRRSWHHKWCIILGELAVLDPPSFAMLGQSVSGLILSRIPMLRHGYETRRNFRQRSLSTKPSVISPNGGIRNLSVVTSNTFPFQASSTASNITVNLPIGIRRGYYQLSRPSMASRCSQCPVPTSPQLLGVSDEQLTVSVNFTPTLGAPVNRQLRKPLARVVYVHLRAASACRRADSRGQHAPSRRLERCSL